MADFEQPAAASPRRQLTLFDSTSIIVGIIIGSSIYKTAPLIAEKVPTSGALLAVWSLGGLFALVGSLCYAELATAFPAEGGDYVFLSRAFGRPIGFLFAWCELCVVRPGSIGALAFVFADYANEVWPLGTYAPVIFAGGAVLLLSLINILGVTTGKWTQNVLTLAKVGGLLAVVAVGLLFSAPYADMPTKGVEPDWSFALILVLYAYGGWNDMAFVGAEVRDPEHNILRALLLGTATVTLIYVLMNVAFLHALGISGTRAAPAVAADVVKLALGSWGARAVSALVAVSALGAVNGMIFTGGRIYYAMGAEHRLFAPLGVWSRRLDTPACSLAVQGGITATVVIAFGLAAQSASAGAFEKLVLFALPLFWTFLTLVGCSLFVLRWREPTRTRPFRVPGYPITPLVFLASTSFMLYASIAYAYAQRSGEALWALGVLAAGVVVCWFAGGQDERRNESASSA